MLYYLINLSNFFKQTKLGLRKMPSFSLQSCVNKNGNYKRIFSKTVQNPAIFSYSLY